MTSINEDQQEIINFALREDLGENYWDLTGLLLNINNKIKINNNKKYKLISKESEQFIISGLIIIEQILNILKNNNINIKNINIEYLKKDGDRVLPNETILTLAGDVRIIWMIERTILNFVQFLSGIATKTRKIVDLINNNNYALKILDTRKTIPGLRRLSKYAVQCGGGVNHRLGLYDAVLIKDNQIDYFGDITTVLNCIPNNTNQKYNIIIEVRSLSELDKILLHPQSEHKISRILLDNMSTQQLVDSVKLVNHRFLLEASGRIDEHNILSIAQTGVNFASIGALTHSVHSIDLSLISD